MGKILHGVRVGIPTAWLCLILGAAWTVPGWATEEIFQTSGLQNPSEGIGASARSAAMGRAFVGLADDSSAFFYNPAGLADLNVPGLAVHHQAGLTGIFQDTLVCAFPLKGGFGLGGAFQYAGYGSLEGRAADGTILPSLGTSQFGLGIGGAAQLVQGLSLGLAFLGTRQDLAGTGYTLFNANAGLLYSTGTGWRFGTSYGNQISTSSGVLSGSILRTGLSKSFTGKGPFGFLAAAAFSLEPQEVNQVLVGMEGSLQSTYFLRAGYRQGLVESGINGLTGLTAGAGVAFQGLNLDYAFEPFGDIGNTHRVSLTYLFGSPSAAAETSKLPTTLPIPSQPVPAQALAQVPVQAPAQVIPEPVTGPTGGPAGDSMTVNFDFPSEDVTSGEGFEKESKWREASAAYVQAIQKNRQNMRAWWRLGNLYYKLNRKEYAIQCYEQVLKLKPDAKSLAEWLEKYKNQVPAPVPTSKP